MLLSRSSRLAHWRYLAAVGLLLTSGCVSWRALQPVSPSVAAARKLARDGVAAMELGQWDEAERLFAAAVKKSPEDGEARRHLAEALWRRGAQDQALQHMAAAAELDDADATTAVRAGEMLLVAGRAEAAARQAERALRINNRLASAWTLRGRAHLAQRQYARASADFQQALHLEPNSAEVLLASAELYSQQNQHRRCLATLHRLLDSTSPGNESAEVLRLEGKTYLALQRPQLAAERLALAAKRCDPDSELCMLQAEAQKALGEPQRAEAFALQALAADAEHAPAEQFLLELSSRPRSPEQPIR